MSRIAVVALVLTMILPATAPAQAPPGDGKPEPFRLRDSARYQGIESGLLIHRPIQEELRMTEAQKEATAPQTILGQFQSEIRALSSIASPQRREAAVQEIQHMMDAAATRALEPAQRERLDQVHLQLQGPEAFLTADVRDRLGLSNDQVAKVRSLVETWRAETQKADIVPLPVGLKLEDRAGSQETALKQIDTPEFRTAARNARRVVREIRESTLRRISQTLTAPQRSQYERMLGAPFDPERFMPTNDDADARSAVRFLAMQTGQVGQRADPDFDPRVARPAYTETHPRVVVDEAHHNFHTAGGRYKPFADLIAADGYRVVPGRAKFSREALAQGDVLVIANALGAEGMGSPGASKPAFTDDECEAVLAWVREGGALLLISDHPPMGSAAAGLAKRFGVEMSEGVAFDPKNSADGPAQLVFSRENRLLGDHPITRGRDESERLGRVVTFTGQSLKGPEGSVAFLKLGDTAVDRREPEGKTASAAGRSQGLALALGKGRVVVLGEAGQLSAQILGPTRRPMGMNVPGVDNRRMALNIMHWLSGRLEPRGG